MFNIDNRDIERFERDLGKFAKRAIPFATKSTLNSAAFSAQKKAQGRIRSEMVLRNPFTLKSVQVDMARTLRISRQSATVGSTADYMEDQEFGSIKMPKGKYGVPIPTSYAAGIGENAQPRTRLPTKSNALQNIILKNQRKRKPKTRKQSNLFKVQDAVTSGRRMVYLDTAKTKGIYKVIGGKRSFKKGSPDGVKVKMVVDLTNQAVTIKPNPWLKPAFDAAAKQIPNFYIQALHFQRKRLQLFKP